jgi:hypothetical protein
VNVLLPDEPLIRLVVWVNASTPREAHRKARAEVRRARAVGRLPNGTRSVITYPDEWWE